MEGTLDRREARLAAALAARSAAPKYGDPIEISVADIRPGDFLVVVPTQDGVRGTRYESVVTGARNVARGEVVEQLPAPLGRVYAPVNGIVFNTGRHGEAGWGSAVHRPYFRATVRRPAA